MSAVGAVYNVIHCPSCAKRSASRKVYLDGRWYRICDRCGACHNVPPPARERPSDAEVQQYARARAQLNRQSQRNTSPQRASSRPRP